MRTLILMVRKDLIRKARSPLGLLVVLAFPIMFSAIISLAFGGGSTPQVYLLVENLDDNLLGNALISAMSSDQMGEYFDVEIVGEEGLSRIEDGDGSALLQIPENFTENIVEGKPCSLSLVRNPAQGIMPEIAEQVSLVLTEILDGGSHVLREPMDALAPYVLGDSLDLSAALVSDISVSIFDAFEGMDEFLNPPVITFSSMSLGSEEGEEEEEEDDSSAGIFQIFLFVFPGISVYALFLVGDLAMRDILTESEAGTLRRQIQGPVSPAGVLVAKAAFSATVAFISLIMLSLIGWIASDGPIDMLGYLVLSLALILAVVGSAAAIYGAAGKLQRGAVISSIVYLFLAFAGGSFFSVEGMPGVVRLIAPISPFYWGTQGYRALLGQGASLTDILPSVGVLSAIGLVFLILGGLLLNRNLVRGGGA
jgi:ABC-type multidrug transport system permease subunit